MPDTSKFDFATNMIFMDDLTSQVCYLCDDDVYECKTISDQKFQSHQRSAADQMLQVHRRSEVVEIELPWLCDDLGDCSDANNEDYGKSRCVPA